MHSVYIHFAENSDLYNVLIIGIITLLGFLYRFTHEIENSDAKKPTKYGRLAIALTIFSMLITLWCERQGNEILNRQRNLINYVIDENDIRFEFMFRLSRNSNVDSIYQIIRKELYLPHGILGDRLNNTKFSIQMDLMANISQALNSRSYSYRYVVFKSKELHLDNRGQDLYSFDFNRRKLKINLGYEMFSSLNELVDISEGRYKIWIKKKEFWGYIDDYGIIYSFPHDAFEDPSN